MTRTETRTLSPQKLIADILTLSRLPIAFLVLLLAIAGGHSALGAGLLLILVGWTTDIFDGRLARMDPNRTHTFIGDADLAVDLVLDAAGWILFVSAGYIPALWGYLYLVSAAAIIAFFPQRTVITYLELPVLALHPVFAFISSPLLGWLYAAWLLGAMVLNRDRLLEILTMLWKGIKR
jgi:phosphatidylglycerophosphate synthase